MWKWRCYKIINTEQCSKDTNFNLFSASCPIWTWKTWVIWLTFQKKMAGHINIDEDYIMVYVYFFIQKIRQT